ncbi:MAG: hypothetical protein AB8G17_08385, partial [Gammaproteobacteria bacterium]
GNCERFSVLFEIHTRALFRVNVWSDRALWLGINVPGSEGWVFAFQGRGLLSSTDLEKFVPRIEDTISAINTGRYNELEQYVLALWDFSDMTSV